MSVNTAKLLTKNFDASVVHLTPVTDDLWKVYRTGFIAGLAESQGFSGKPGQVLIIPDRSTGKPSSVMVGVASMDDMWALSAAAEKLPAGTYRLDDTDLPAPLTSDQAYKLSVGWSLARYKWKVKDGQVDSDPGTGPVLVVPKVAQDRFDEIDAEVQATWLVRNLINAPANILNTNELSDAVAEVAAAFNASTTVLAGPALATHFPLIQAVGQASANEPLLAGFSWEGSQAQPDSPSILLVGKGVTFDTGGVQIKPGDSMKGMKKDMGGAATVLGLARMIMANDLPVKLDVLIPIAENSVSANAYRPTDVIKARDGTLVEIGHTDAEGRLILADALSAGVEECNPDLIIDFATLTGAQRVADGTEVGGIFCNDKETGRRMEDIGAQWGDDLQLHHLFEKYRPLLKSKNGGDICSTADGGPGATMAAMFLQHFIRAARPETKWFHFDINGANVGAKPGRPAGGEAMGMRAAYRFIKAEFKL